MIVGKGEGKIPAPLKRQKAHLLQRKEINDQGVSINFGKTRVSNKKGTQLQNPPTKQEYGPLSYLSREGHKCTLMGKES